MTATSTEIPVISADVEQTLKNIGYGQAEIDQFKREYSNISEGTYQFTNDQGEVDAVVYNGIVGTKADGSKELLTLKFSDNPNRLKLSSSEIKNLADQVCKGSCWDSARFFL